MDIKTFKSKIMKKFINILCTFLLFITNFSCDREWNNWEVDSNADGLFRPLTFEQSNLLATSIEIAYSQVLNASHYVFEFSKDSLLFNEIVRRDTILRDTLTAYADNDSPMKVEFHTWFNKLEGETKYSVRMKAYSATSGKETAYSSFFFETPGEQIFTDALAELDQVVLSWIPDNSVDFIRLFSKQTEGGYGAPVDYEISSEEISSGSKVITGLQMGTSYLAEIYSGEKRRGSITFRTSGLLDSQTLIVTTDMDGGDVQSQLETYVQEGVESVSIIFYAGEYNMDKLKVPAGIRNLALVGMAETLDEDKSVLPLIHFKQFEFQGKDSDNSTLSYVSLENLNLQGLAESMFYMKDGSAAAINISGCYLENYDVIVNMKNGGKRYESISLYNCIISQCKTLIDNTGGDQESIGKISITQSTLVNSGTWINSKKKGLQNITIDKCTFYNHTFGTGNLFRFDVQPASVIVTNVIFSGDNAGQLLGMYKNYDYIDFSSCYITSDLQQAKYGFTNINNYAGTSNDLFVNPENGDFHIKSIANFSGKKDAGDSRWGVEEKLNNN